MKRIVVMITAALMLAGMCLAGTITGYISDEGCARNGEARNAACAKNCIQNGATAVLVADDGTIYSIADQEKVRKLGGEMVAVTGTIDGESIKVVEKAELCSESAHCKG